MNFSKLSVYWLFIVTLYCNHTNPCIHWVLHDTNAASLRLTDEFIGQYHHLFPEHLDYDNKADCSSTWRMEGYIYRNFLQAPAFNSIFGVLGSPNRSNIQVIQLNLSVFDLQIPDRDAEHILIEYSVSKKSFKQKKILQELAFYLNKQLTSIMQAKTIEMPIYLNALSDLYNDIDHSEFWLRRDLDLKPLN